MQDDVNAQRRDGRQLRRRRQIRRLRLRVDAEAEQVDRRAAGVQLDVVERRRRRSKKVCEKVFLCFIFT